MHWLQWAKDAVFEHRFDLLTHEVCLSHDLVSLLLLYSIKVKPDNGIS